MNADVEWHYSAEGCCDYLETRGRWGWVRGWGWGWGRRRRRLWWFRLFLLFVLFVQDYYYALLIIGLNFYHTAIELSSLRYFAPIFIYFHKIYSLSKRNRNNNMFLFQRNILLFLPISILMILSLVITYFIPIFNIFIFLGLITFSK